jgi:ABC-type molybdate transport system permease subunit
MEAFSNFFDFWGMVITSAFYILLFFFFFRVVRAIEKIADNLETIAGAHTRSADAMQRIADNENAGE